MAVCGLHLAVVGRGPAEPTIVAVRVAVKGARVRLDPGVRRGESFDAGRLDSAGTRLSRRLSELGFIRNRVSWDSASRGAGIDVRFQVETGPRARIAGWSVAGDGDVAGPVLAVLPARGAAFSRAALERAVGAAVAACEDAGYPFARVSATAIDDSAGWVRPTLAVSAGDFVRVDFLESSEPERVSSSLLERSARFRAGRVFSPGLVRTWRRNVLRTGWVRPDSEQVVSAAERQGVRFFVTAGRANRVDAAAGYVPDERRLTGFARVGFLNVLNSGRQLTAGWQSAGARTGYELGYTEPWVLGSNLGLTASARHTTADTSYSYTEASAGGVVYGGGLEVGVGTGFDRAAGIDSLNRAQTLWVGTGVRADLRDDPDDPRRGVLAALRTRAGQRRSRSESGLVGRVETDAQLLVPVAARIAGAVSAAGRGAFAPAELAEPELYRMGGASSVRGFREEWFASSRLGWLNCELRYRFAAGSRAYPFFDCGAYADGRSWRLAAGYGAGVRWQTRAGRLGLDYGIALGESLLRGKVHISFTAGF